MNDRPAAATGPSTDLTLIITTSPVPSIPSTQLISTVLSSIFRSTSNTPTLPTIITFDNYTISTNPAYRHGRLKRGQIPPALAAAYPAYQAAVQDLFPGPKTKGAAIGWGQEDVVRGDNVTFLRQHKHCGFALGVRAALKYVATPYVLVVQHDWAFEEHVSLPPLGEIVGAMRAAADGTGIGYVTFSSRRSEGYVLGKGGNNTRVAAVFAAAGRHRVGEGELRPAVHLLDRPHVMAVETYAAVFEGRLEGLTAPPFPRLRRGDFLEDTVGSRYAGLIKGAATGEEAVRQWALVGAWMWCRGDEERVVRHLSGRTVLADEEQRKRVEGFKRLGMQAAAGGGDGGGGGSEGGSEDNESRESDW